MKKAGLITIHNAINYGAVLQALATQRTLESLDYDTEIIDYLPTFTKRENAPVRKKPGLRGKVIGAIDLLSWYERKKKMESFKAFREQFMKLTPEVTDCEGVRSFSGRYDLLIAGSDQIWNPKITLGLDPAYFCAYAKENQRCISYASSFGDRVKEMSLEDKKQIASYLGRFSALSARELSGKNFLEGINLKAEHVLDPTLLLTREEWQFAMTPPKKEIKKPYILIYSVGRTRELIRYAKRIQKEKNLSVIVLNSLVKYPYPGVSYLSDASPGEVLYLLDHAELIVTSSFHGTAFSVNFNKPFLAFPSAKVTKNRASEFLELIGLEKQFLSFDTPYRDGMTEIDWESANKALNEQREKSKGYLQKSLQEGKDA